MKNNYWGVGGEDQQAKTHHFYGMCKWDCEEVEVGENLQRSSGSTSLFRAGLAPVSLSGLCLVVFFNVTKDGRYILSNLLEKLTTLKVKQICFPYV